MEYKKKKLFLDFGGTLTEFKNMRPDIYSAKGFLRNLIKAIKNRDYHYITDKDYMSDSEWESYYEWQAKENETNKEVEAAMFKLGLD